MSDHVLGADTSYTLWSKGRLLGHSELDYVRCLPKLRTGDFYPTEIGETLMPTVTGESLELELRAPDGSPVPTEWIDVRDNEFTLSLAREDDYLPPDPLCADTEEEKRLIASIEHDAALLEEWFGPDWDCDADDKPWEERPSFPRYQIHVELLDDAAIP